MSPTVVPADHDESRRRRPWVDVRKSRMATPRARRRISLRPHLGSGARHVSGGYRERGDTRARLDRRVRWCGLGFPMVAVDEAFLNLLRPAVRGCIVEVAPAAFVFPPALRGLIAHVAQHVEERQAGVVLGSDAEWSHAFLVLDEVQPNAA